MKLFLHTSVWLQNSRLVLLDPCCLWKCGIKRKANAGWMQYIYKRIMCLGICLVRAFVSSTKSRNHILVIFISVTKHYSPNIKMPIKGLLTELVASKESVKSGITRTILTLLYNCIITSPIGFPKTGFSKPIPN